MYELLRWETIPRDWADYYKCIMPAGSRAALVAVQVNESQIPEYAFVAIGEAQIERFLVEYEYCEGMSPEAMLAFNQKRVNAGQKPAPIKFRKVKRSELLENRRK